MKFNQLILEKLAVIFQKYHLHYLEQRDNYLKLASDDLEIIITHNQFENSNTLWLGRNNETTSKVEIDNDTLKLFFKSDLKLSQVSLETFISNLVLFFENEAKPLLMGDLNRINELEKFDLKRSQNYTDNLLERQNLEVASKAWEIKDYKTFIGSIDKIDIDKVPESFQLKYKIAKQKL